MLFETELGVGVQVAPELDQLVRLRVDARRPVLTPNRTDAAGRGTRLRVDFRLEHGNQCTYCNLTICR